MEKFSVKKKPLHAQSPGNCFWIVPWALANSLKVMSWIHEGKTHLDLFFTAA